MCLLDLARAGVVDYYYYYVVVGAVDIDVVAASVVDVAVGNVEQAEELAGMES